MNARPAISYRSHLEPLLKEAVEGVPSAQYVEQLRRLARKSVLRRKRVLARMALNAAIAEAVRASPVRQLSRIMSERSRLGFESTTDMVLSYQAVVVGAMDRPALKPAASRALLEIEARAARAAGIERQTAWSFVSRMRKRLDLMEPSD